jgi:hypothetical protein
MHQLRLGTKDILCFVLGHLMPDIANEIYGDKTMLKVVSLMQEH